MFWRILISYCIIGFLMAFPSYRLGLRPVLAAVVFVGVSALGAYHAAVAVRAAKREVAGQEHRG